MTCARHPVYSIPAHLPFLDVLAAHLLEETHKNPISLASYTIFLPTRRACHTLKEAFVRTLQGENLILPTMLALGDTDAELTLLTALQTSSDANVRSTLKEIPHLTRLGLLSQLIAASTLKQGSNHSGHTGAVTPLAAQLAHFIDEVNRAELTFDKLDTLVPSAYAHHWQTTLEFLKIVTHHWPSILAEKGFIDSSAYRRDLLQTCADQWQTNSPDAPIIAAGITHTTPAHLRLLTTLAKLQQGRIIFAGLDMSLRDGILETINPGHPHYHHATLLNALACPLEEVREIIWPPTFKSEISPSAKARTQLISRAFSPDPHFHSVTNVEEAHTALNGWTTIECESPCEEAITIALIMREALEHPTHTAALITPDRSLARRVIAELKRWNIEVNDSAGVPLNETPLGVFLLLLAECAAYSFDPIKLLSLLKHPLVSGGLKTVAFRAYARELERLILRNDVPPMSLNSIETCLMNKHPEQMGLITWFKSIARVINSLHHALGASTSLRTILKKHIEAAEELAATDDTPGTDRLWKNEIGLKAAEWFASLLEQSDAFAMSSPIHYPTLLKELMATETIHPSHALHPRLFIWGTIESRLQKVDRVILGAVNEQTWNPATTPDPWLNRPMRAAFGLPPVEQTLSLVANDFAYAFCSPEVFITRSIRVNGIPTSPARWLLRLETVLHAVNRNVLRKPSLLWQSWARDLDRPSSLTPCTPPQPCPPVSARPRQLSVTSIGTLLKDPYAIYAQHILRLKPLKPLVTYPHAGHKGTLIHETLEKFVRIASADKSRETIQTLLDIGREIFEMLAHMPIVSGYWWPRFIRIAEWFISQECERASSVSKRITEAKGSLGLSLPGGLLTLTAVADRLDYYHDGSLEIIDYKTGAVPSMKDIASGQSPQIPLEAAIALHGTFADIPAFNMLRAPSFWQLTGGQPAGEIKPMKDDIYDLTEVAFKGVTMLLSTFDDPATPYTAQAKPTKYNAFFDPYHHLKRAQEWASPEDSE